MGREHLTLSSFEARSPTAQLRRRRLAPQDDGSLCGAHAERFRIARCQSGGAS
jgi:hypothetical protein